MLQSMIPKATLAALLATFAAAAGAQGIYTCVDAKGRRLTADRPIIDCIDREQTELSSGGLPRRRIAPSPTAAERAAEAARLARLADERKHADEEKKQERALVSRYPNRPAHDKERREALARVDSLKALANTRIAELLAQRKAMADEHEFYRSPGTPLPARLKHQMEEVDRQLAVQQRSLVEQDAEKGRINARFDAELQRLTLLWAKQAVVPAVSPPASASAVR
ncbi:MAG TPA: DUF4124 domain-containing protein [Burkholderiaceae bacterium]